MEQVRVPLTDYYINITEHNVSRFLAEQHERDTVHGTNPVGHRVAWWENGGNVAQLLRWLNESEPLQFSTVIEIVERPWKWTDEWNAMQAATVQRNNQQEQCDVLGRCD